jgi:hypothetical protein
MPSVRLSGLLALLLLLLPFASVYAQGYQINEPRLGTSGAPALSGTQFSGIITVLYSDGSPVYLGSNVVKLNLCSLSCVTISTTLKQTAPGTYAYSFTPPSSLTGTIIISVSAGGLADDNGKIFPSVDTQIGAYATPSLTSSSPASVQTGTAGAPITQRKGVVGQAVSLSPKQSATSPILEVAMALMVLGFAGVAILVLPRKR